MKKSLYDYYVIENGHRAGRIEAERNLAEEFSALGLPAEERMARRFEYLVSLEKPRIHPDEKIVFTRTVKNLPAIFTDSEWDEIKKKNYIRAKTIHQ